MYAQFWSHGIIRRAIEQSKISVATINIRDFAKGRHRVTDDRPYGGGYGMVMKPEPLEGAIRFAQKDVPQAKTILLTPQGLTFNQQTAHELARLDGLILVSGRYEGIDERICGTCVDYEISIGDYVLSGGEIAAMVLIEAITRLIPGVLGGAGSAAQDSFSSHLLAHAHYTRPPLFQGEAIPEVLRSGNHQAIARWRLESALMRTLCRRRDLLETKQLTPEEIDILKKWYADIGKIIAGQSICGTDTLSGCQ